MLYSHVVRCLSTTTSAIQGYQIAFFQTCRAYSSRSTNESEEADFDAARAWYRNFTRNTLPTKIAKTSYSKSSGPGGQKTNKTSSKATTVWPVQALLGHVPKVLHPDIRNCRYYVLSSDSITIQCDVHRSQSENEAETHQRLFEEIIQIYKNRVPGITSPETKKRIEQLKKADNLARLKSKKMLSAKKKSRKGGGGHGGDD